MLTPCRQVLIPARLWPKAPNRTQAPIPYLISCGGERAARSWCRCPQISLRAVTIGPELYKGWLSGRLRRGGRGGRRRSVPSEALAKTLGHLVDHLHILLARGAERVAHLLQQPRSGIRSDSFCGSGRHSRSAANAKPLASLLFRRAV